MVCSCVLFFLALFCACTAQHTAARGGPWLSSALAPHGARALSPPHRSTATSQDGSRRDPVSPGEMQDALPLPHPPSTLTLLPWPLHAGTAPGELKMHLRAKAVGSHILSVEQSLAPQTGVLAEAATSLGDGGPQVALLAWPWLPGAQRRVPAVPIAPMPFTGTGRAEQGAPGPAAGVQAGEKGRLLGNIPLELR